VYLATAPKSNSMFAYFAAKEELERSGSTEVPVHLRDASRDAKALGHGKDYKYPHDQPGHHVAQQYLPDALRGKQWYGPSEEGYEREIAERLRRWRESS
jgi:putative ATPase